MLLCGPSFPGLVQGRTELPELTFWAETTQKESRAVCMETKLLAKMITQPGHMATTFVTFT